MFKTLYFFTVLFNSMSSGSCLLSDHAPELLLSFNSIQFQSQNQLRNQGVLTLYADHKA